VIGAELCVLDLSVQPGARHTGIDGLHDGALRVRLAAPPVDGKANSQLLAWLATELRCPKRDSAAAARRSIAPQAGAGGAARAGRGHLAGPGAVPLTWPAAAR
jgi:hypothetical protein